MTQVTGDSRFRCFARVNLEAELQSETNVPRGGVSKAAVGRRNKPKVTAIPVADRIIKHGRVGEAEEFRFELKLEALVQSEITKYTEVTVEDTRATDRVPVSVAEASIEDLAECGTIQPFKTAWYPPTCH